MLAEITVEANPDGYEELVAFANEHSGLRAWAIEGTGSHGAGLTRHLAKSDELVVELDRPERQKRRNGAKSDPLDAIRAAREALSRTKLGTPRDDRRAPGTLGAARSEALGGRGGEDAQRSSSRSLSPLPSSCARSCEGSARSRWRGSPRAFASAPSGTSRPELPRACCANSRVGSSSSRQKLNATRRRSSPSSGRGGPSCSTQQGVGPIVAATVLCAWSHPGRVRSEAAFAKLSGAAPIPANSGQVTTHYRLNPYGDRQLNWALHTVVLSRMRWDEETQAYVKRRTAEGKTHGRSSAA